MALTEEIADRDQCYLFFIRPHQPSLRAEGFCKLVQSDVPIHFDPRPEYCILLQAPERIAGPATSANAPFWIISGFFFRIPENWSSTRQRIT